MGEMWGCRPSSFFAGLSEMAAFQIDTAATMLVLKRRAAAEPEPYGRDIYL